MTHPNHRDAESNGDSDVRALLRPRKIAMQLFGFAVGIALLVWCIWGAATQADWNQVLEASPWLVVGMIGCTIVSVVINGAAFAVLIRPVGGPSMRELILLNMGVSILNYAPIKAGLILRIVHHIRIDRIPLLRLTGWFGSVVFTVVLGIGAVTVATVLRPSIDWIWALLIIGQLVIAGTLTLGMLRHPLVVEYARGIDRMLSDPKALFWALVIRLIDLGAFTGRIACAAAIIGLTFSTRDLVLLAMATMILTFNPIGRVGVREAGVAIVASMLTSAEMTGDQVSATMQQLTLIDSAGEVLGVIPLGVIGLLWMRSRWKRAAIERAGTSTATQEEATT